MPSAGNTLIWIHCFRAGLNPHEATMRLPGQDARAKSNPVKFKIGDKVLLDPQSPIMTVHEKSKNGRVVCCWFASRKLETAVFSEAELMKATACVGLADEVLKRAADYVKRRKKPRTA